MTVTKAYTVDHDIFDITATPLRLHFGDAQSQPFLIGNLCNHSHLSRKGDNVGQATEVALMNVLPTIGLSDQRPVSHDRPAIEPITDPTISMQYFHRQSEVTFSSEHKYQSVTGVFTNVSRSEETTYLSGAIEAVLPQCKFYLRSDSSISPLEQGLVKIILSKAAQLASTGLRIVGMASGTNPEALVFAGLQGMMDPPRPGVDRAIAQLTAGGIQVVMITGDAESTALSIARQLGIRINAGHSGCLTGKDIDAMSQRQLTERISGISVFARTTPRHKMAIIEAFQARGAVVAMTGDGVNDAVALRQADIGVAMGKSGTDVAKEAADVILVDDNFATLLPAVEEGRLRYSSHVCGINGAWITHRQKYLSQHSKLSRISTFHRGRCLISHHSVNCFAPPESIESDAGKSNYIVVSSTLLLMRRCFH